jgi:hypothetical protein
MCISVTHFCMIVKNHLRLNDFRSVQLVSNSDVLLHGIAQGIHVFCASAELRRIMIRCSEAGRRCDRAQYWRSTGLAKIEKGPHED